MEPEPREISTRDVSFHDSSFVHHVQNAPGELKVTYSDKYRNEHTVTVPVEQEARTDGGFNMLPKWSSYRHVAPKVIKKRLREIGGAQMPRVVPSDVVKAADRMFPNMVEPPTSLESRRAGWRGGGSWCDCSRKQTLTVTVAGPHAAGLQTPDAGGGRSR
jgi:hypothetical protein